MAILTTWKITANPSPTTNIYIKMYIYIYRQREERLLVVITGGDDQDGEENKNNVSRLQGGLVGRDGTHSSPTYILLKLGHFLLRQTLRYRLRTFKIWKPYLVSFSFQNTPTQHQLFHTFKLTNKKQKITNACLPALLPIHHSFSLLICFNLKTRTKANMSAGAAQLVPEEQKPTHFRIWFAENLSEQLSFQLKTASKKFQRWNWDWVFYHVAKLDFWSSSRVFSCLGIIRRSSRIERSKCFPCLRINSPVPSWHIKPSTTFHIYCYLKLGPTHLCRIISFKFSINTCLMWNDFWADIYSTSYPIVFIFSKIRCSNFIIEKKVRFSWQSKGSLC